MAPMTLLQRARSAGLEVFQDGRELVVRGPASAEPIANELLDAKPQVKAELLAEDVGRTLGYSVEILDIRSEEDPPYDLRQLGGRRRFTTTPPSGPLTPEEEAILDYIHAAGKEGTSWTLAASAVGDSEAHRIGWLNLGYRDFIHYSSRAKNVVVTTKGENHKSR